MRRRSAIRAFFAVGAGNAGFAVPTVLFAILAASALGGAAVTASLSAQSGTVRDQDTKAALATAEAGLANAVLRFNSAGTATCAALGAAFTLGADGWCSPAVVGAIDRGSYSYRVRPVAAITDPPEASAPAQITVVSTGTIGDATRRVTADAYGYVQGYKPFGAGWGVIGLDGVTLNGGAKITANTATNGNIGLNTGAVLTCNAAQVGVGKGYNPSNGTATCTAQQGSIALPPVNPGDVATNNSNSRICTLDPCANASWNASTKRLSIGGNGGHITLGASGGEFNYALCKLTLNANSYLLVAADATVRIYFLAPEVCANETQPLVLNSGSKIEKTGEGNLDLALLVVGSDTRATSLPFNADSALISCDQSFALYAPRTAITLNSKSSICGGVAGKSVTVSANTTLLASTTAVEWELPGVPGIVHYGKVEGFAECTATAVTGAPDGGC